MIPPSGVQKPRDQGRRGGWGMVILRVADAAATIFRQTGEGKVIESFHRLLRGALAGEALGWRGLIGLIAPTAGAVGAHYFPGVWAKEELAAGDVLLELHRDNATCLREFKGTAENEFLFFLRDFILQLGESKEHAAVKTKLPVELLRKLLEGLPYVPKQILVMGAKGYPAAQVGKILKIDEKHAREVIEAAKARLKEIGREQDSEELFHAGWRVLQGLRKESAKEACVPHRTFVRIADGQITWREKEAAEQHMKDCLRCLDGWTNYQEMCMYYASLPPAGEALVESILGRMGFEVEEKPSLSARFAGMFKR